MQAFSDQLLKYQPSLVGLALRFTSNEESAKDLVQETFLKALMAKHSFNNGSNLWA